jgi:hypothetical protein
MGGLVGDKLSGRPWIFLEGGWVCSFDARFSASRARLEEPSGRGGGASWNQKAVDSVAEVIGAFRGAVDPDAAGGGPALMIIATGAGAA